MADIKKAGEEADRMILELAQQRKAAPAEQVVEPQESVGLVTDPQEVVAIDPPVVGVSTESTTSVVPDAMASLRKDVDDANQRWKSLQGMINKKDVELDNMRALLAQVSQKPEPAPETAPAQSYTDADWERGIGELELRAIYDSRVEQLVAPKINALLSRIAELEKHLKGVSEVTKHTQAEVFDDALARQVPDWKSVNIDPAFLAWLEEEDGFTGYKKLDLLKDAYSRSDLARTAKFFAAFKAETGKAVAPVVVEPKKDNVTKLITPGKSKSSSTPTIAPDTKQIWSKSDIARLYDDKRNNRISQADFDMYERDLFLAQRENRIAA